MWAVLYLLIIATIVIVITVEGSKDLVSKIGFGSCNKVERFGNNIWSTIAKQNPDRMLLLGDNHYSDTLTPVGNVSYVTTLHSITSPTCHRFSGRN